MRPLSIASLLLSACALGPAAHLAAQSPGPVVSVEWLAERLEDPGVVVLQAETDARRFGEHILLRGTTGGRGRTFPTWRAGTPADGGAESRASDGGPGDLYSR